MAVGLWQLAAAIVATLGLCAGQAAQKGTKASMCTLPRLDLAASGALATFQRRFLGRSPVVFQNVPLAASCRSITWLDLNRSWATQASAEVDSLGIARQGSLRFLVRRRLCMAPQGSRCLAVVDPRSVRLGNSEVMRTGCFPSPGYENPSLFGPELALALPDTCKPPAALDTLFNGTLDGSGNTLTWVEVGTSGTGCGLPWHWHGEVLANVILSGAKRWFVSQHPDQYDTDPFLSSAAWQSQAHNVPLRTARHATATWLQCDLHPGDGIYVPPGQAHQTLNLAPTTFAVLGTLQKARAGASGRTAALVRFAARCSRLERSPRDLEQLFKTCQQASGVFPEVAEFAWVAAAAAIQAQRWQDAWEAVSRHPFRDPRLWWLRVRLALHQRDSDFATRTLQHLVQTQHARGLHPETCELLCRVSSPHLRAHVPTCQARTIQLVHSTRTGPVTRFRALYALFLCYHAGRSFNLSPLSRATLDTLEALLAMPVEELVPHRPAVSTQVTGAFFDALRRQSPLASFQAFLRLENAHSGLFFRT